MDSSTRSPETLRRILTGLTLALLVMSVTLVRPSDADGAPTQTSAVVIDEAFDVDEGGFTPVAGGSWEVSDGAYVLADPATAPVLGNLSLHRTTLFGDFELTVDFTVTPTTSDWDDVAVVFGYIDDGNYYMASFNESNDDATNGLFRMSNGELVELADFAVTTPSGKPHHATISVTEDGAAVHRDGDLLGSAPIDDEPMIGAIGLGTRNDGARFDNVVVRGTAFDDTEPPTPPTGLAAELPYPTEVHLRWDAAEDDFAVKGYLVYRDGEQIADVSDASFMDADVVPSTTYHYTVRAYDYGDNASAHSEPLVTTTLPADTTPPSRPTGLTGEAPNASQVSLTWQPAHDDYGVTGYTIVRRGQDIATVTGTTFTDSGLDPGRTYLYQIRAVDRAGNVSRPGGRPVVVRTPSQEVQMPYNQDVIDLAAAEPLAAFTLNREFGSQEIRGATAMHFLTTVATYEPRHRTSSSVPVTDLVLDHIRNLIHVPGNEPGCSGGLDTTSINLAIHSFAIAKTVPEIWDELSAAERDKITLLVQACLVASHWLHDDGNDFDTGINQLGNTNKNWNPNHVEGGVGMGLAAAYYLGAEQAEDFLLTFDAAEFRQRLEKAEFPSTSWVFDQTSAEDLNAATRSTFTYRGHPLSEPWAWIAERARITYARIVAPTGAAGRGYVVAGADELPNVGEQGMATEFESTDGEGLRSDIRYVSLGWNNSLVNLWLVDYFGDRPATGGDSTLRLYTVGTTDLLYKAERGYRSFSLGVDRGVYGKDELHNAMGLRWLASLWHSKSDEFARDQGDPNEPPVDAAVALADAYIRAGAYADDNFGQSASLAVKTDPNPDFHREAVIMFDLAAAPTAFDQALMEFTAQVSDSAGTEIDVEIYAVGSEWTEDTVTWNTRPALGDHLATVHIDSQRRRHRVDLTDYVRTQRATGHARISVAVRQDPPTGRGLNVNIPSRIDPAAAPQLIFELADKE